MKKLNLCCLWFISLAFICISLISCESTNDFDLMCSYFDMLEKENVTKDLSSDDKFNFINSLVKDHLQSDGAARVSWNAVIGYVPAEGRYALYKDAAEITLNKTWACLSMEKLLKDIYP